MCDERLRAALLNIDKVGRKTKRERGQRWSVCAGMVSSDYHPGNYNHISAEEILERRERKLKVISGKSRLQH